MTAPQLVEVDRLCNHFGLHHGIHGGCKGADEQFHMICKRLGKTIEVWPSDMPWTQFDFSDAHVVHPPNRPLERNGDIVRSGEVLIAAPDQAHEVVRSGTWATVRRARYQNKVRYIVAPNGTSRKEDR